MRAATIAHAVAREEKSPAHVAVARSVGHAVATAHMADHSVGAALYARRAVRIAGESVEEEAKWQLSRLLELAAPIAGVVLDTMAKKGRSIF